jgi:hypothetical protein
MKMGKIILGGYTSWCMLGFVRGVKYYNYTHNKEEQYLYSNGVYHGFIGVIIYGNPFFFPITICKEGYRLEVNIRNLEKEKNKTYYYDLL